ncbi:MAG: 50S ribosomal protein L17 [Bdellovibrionales bacterium]|nr:50S ribosomal protein L17 [Bdellovibrionales bacterium]
MRHRVAGRKFGRRIDERRALFRGLATNLIDEGRIKTTLEKAKELRKIVEPLVTIAKKDDLHARRQVAGRIYKKESVKKLFEEWGPMFKDRNGGYTRIYKYTTRQGDGAKLALIEFVQGDKKSSTKTEKKQPKATKMKASEKKTKEASSADTVKASSKSKTAPKKKAAKKTTKTTKKSTKKD